MNTQALTHAYPYIPLLLAFYLAAVKARAWRRGKYRLPPGPKGHPILGNISEFPDPAHTRAWELFSDWGRRYGGIVCAKLLGRTFIIVNDLGVATDLLVKKGAIYSDRTSSPMLRLAGLGDHMTNVAYNQRFKEYRKFMTKSIGTPRATVKFHPIYRYHACMLVKRLLSGTNDVFDVRAVKNATGAVQLDFTHGYRIQEEHDPIVAVLEKMEYFVPRIHKPGHYLVDFLPVLRFIPAWFPGAQFKRVAEDAKSLMAYLTNHPFELVQKEMAAGTSRQSFVSDNLFKGHLTEEQVYNLKWSANSLFSAGTHTMEATLISFFLAMTANPEVQRKLNAEIEQIVGHQRLPTFEDRDSMPYLQATVKEVFRWLPAAPLGLIHLLSEDDIYQGYVIPKGSLVIANVWHMLHDPERYADPLTFKPERFLGPCPEADPYQICFGFGRRVCPGTLVADAFVWAVVATSAAAIDIRKAKNAKGETVEPVCMQQPGFVAKPIPFDCNIQVRNQTMLKLVEEAIMKGDTA